VKRSILIFFTLIPVWFLFSAAGNPGENSVRFTGESVETEHNLPKLPQGWLSDLIPAGFSGIELGGSNSKERSFQGYSRQPSEKSASGSNSISGAVFSQDIGRCPHVSLYIFPYHYFW
jgi:hypothetical protein